MPVINVYEYSCLSIEGKFKDSHFKQLVKYNELHGNKYFNIGNKRIYFKNYVGVLQIGDLIIEILPKADNTQGEEAKIKWHNALIYMLHICGYLKIDSISSADIQIQNLTLIDVFYKAFLAEVETIAHQGLIRKYRYNTENRNYLKGRLVFSKHISQNYLHKEKFYTSAQVYDHNNYFNQILLKALKILKNNCKSSSFYSEICNILCYFDNISDVNICEDTFKNIQYSRNTEKYSRAISLARLIIQNYSPDVKSGVYNVVGILFDMNTLYEKVVYRLLKKQETLYSQNQLKLFSQYSKNFWNNKTIRPDILGEYVCSAGNKKMFIIDTKWKRPIDGSPADDDLKQMYTYNVHLGAYLSILLYPEYEKSSPKSGMFSSSVSISNEYKKHSCSTFYIQMFNKDGKIRKDAGVELLNGILNDSTEAYICDQ